jgi:nitrogen regulatory protein PII
VLRDVKPARAVGTLFEIVALLRPQRRAETRRALEAAGVTSYTAYPVLGRSRQRGLRFPAEGGRPAIQFLPKQLFSIVVGAGELDAAVNAIIQANRTGQLGDGKIFVVALEDAVRVSTGERGEEAR